MQAAMRAFIQRHNRYRTNAHRCNDDVDFTRLPLHGPRAGYASARGDGQQVDSLHFVAKDKPL